MMNQLVADEIRSWMGRRRVTGEALAQRTGFTPTYISRRLRGKTTFDLDDLHRIAAVLSVPMQTMLAPALEARDKACTLTADEQELALSRWGTSPSQSVTHGDEGSYEIKRPWSRNAGQGRSGALAALSLDPVTPAEDAA